MNIRNFLKIISGSFFVKSYCHLNIEKQEDVDLFFRLMKKENYDDAELMINNGLSITQQITRGVNKVLLGKLLNSNLFPLVDKKNMSSLYKEELKDNREPLNNLLRFLLKNKLLKIDFLYETQNINQFLVKDIEIKQRLVEDYKSLSKSKMEAKISRLDSEVENIKRNIKKYLMSANNIIIKNNATMFRISVSFKDSIDLLDKDQIENVFDTHSDFLNHISIKDVLSISDDEKKNDTFLKDKFSKLNEEQLEKLKIILNSQYLTNMLIVTQLPRYLIKKAVEEDNLLPEDIIFKINKSFPRPRDEVRLLMMTVAQLYPECLIKVEKELAERILEKIKEVYRSDVGEDKFNSSISFHKFWQNIKNDVDGTTKQNKEDKNQLKKFLEKKRNQIEDIDYVAFAKAMGVDQSVINTLTNVKEISSNILLKLADDKSTQSLENQQYIVNTSKSIVKSITDYSQLKDLFNSKEMDNDYYESLNKSILEFKSGLQSIAMIINQENLNSLITNNNKSSIRMK